MREDNAATIVIKVNWEKDYETYELAHPTELCTVVGGDTKEPKIYVAKTENPDLLIKLKLRANRQIEGLCFSETSSPNPVEPTAYVEGYCGPGFTVRKIVPPPKGERWEAIVTNKAADPQDGFDLTLWLNTEIGRVRVDPRVYNHGHTGDGGLLKAFLAWIRRLIRFVRRL